MKNSVSIITIIILGVTAMSACAQQSAQHPQSVSSGASDQTSTTPSGLTVSTSVPVESGPISQITPDSSVEQSAGGQKTVTLADKGKTLSFAPGESFLLKLGERYTWDISISDQNVISRVKNMAVINGAQGIYEALKTGTVTLSAIGDPLCRQSKHPCGMPSILFEITIVVK
jgi:hypothetical protein